MGIRKGMEDNRTVRAGGRRMKNIKDLIIFVLLIYFSFFGAVKIFGVMGIVVVSLILIYIFNVPEEVEEDHECEK